MKAYYNEHDKRAAAWLRELIREGHIADGDVDERSIADVRPADLSSYGQCHFFAGIGGWSLALRLAGIDDSTPIWTGSCPCQPFSSAGKQRGTADERHLWPQGRRLIAECSPTVVFGEQVASKLGRGWLSGVRADLEALGYGVGAADLCAASAGAPHIRQRLYWMAYNASVGQGRRASAAGPDGRALAELGSALGGLANGESRRLGEHGSASRLPGYADFGSETGGLGDSANARSQRAGQGLPGTGRKELFTGSGGSACGLGLAESDDECGMRERDWRAFDILPCTDGKARRIEPGSFPLAHGVPGRVGLLRGYGNAILPPLASEFIKATGLT